MMKRDRLVLVVICNIPISNKCNIREEDL